MYKRSWAGWTVTSTDMMQLPAAVAGLDFTKRHGRDHLISKLPTAILQLGYWVFAGQQGSGSSFFKSWKIHTY